MLQAISGAIILAPDFHLDSDDRDRYSVIYTHQTRGLFGRLTFFELGNNSTVSRPRIRTVDLS